MVQLCLTDIGRTYAGTPPVNALSDVSFEIPPGDFVSFVGPSGSGKSTLLNLVAMLDKPSSGTYMVDGCDVAGLSERDRAALRSATFGFVFQSFHLLDRYTAAENVEMGLLYRGLSRRARHVEALAALEQVGMSERSQHPANKLSGGESQRVAIARALVGGTPVLVADEPTGNLDSENGQALADLFCSLHRSGKTIVLVTHDASIAAVAERQITLRDGRLDSQAAGGSIAPRSSSILPESAEVDSEPSDAGTSTVVTANHDVSPPGKRRSSQVRLHDFVSDALHAAMARRGRAAALVATVAVASALVVATLGLSETASAQVSEEFDLRRNREVTVNVTDRLGSGASQGSVDGEQTAVPPDTERRIQRLAGVKAVGYLTNLEQQSVSASPAREPHQIVTMSVSDGLLETVDADVEWLPGHDERLGRREVIVGNVPAQQLELSSLHNTPALVINGVSFAVAGVIDGVQRYPELLSSVLVPHEDVEDIGAVGPTTVLIQTASGAAQQVAGQVALALDPVDPDRFDVHAPVDPTSLRAAVESDVTTAMVVLSAVAFIAAVVGIANAMTMGVVERTSEFGLRRALGARPFHVLSQVATEALSVGVLGGVVGLYVGMAGVLGVTLARHWEPVLDMRLVPLAIALGALAGVLGGLAAGLRASRIQPIDALRR